jgi:hypothetical protein
MAQSNNSIIEMNKLLKMTTDKPTNITIDGESMTVVNNLVIKQSSTGGTVVMVDGIPACTSDVMIDITINGDVNSIVLGSGSISCANVHNGVQTVSGDVGAENVYGSVTTTSGDINCDDIAGNASTVSGDINCDDIGGNASTISGDIY